MVRASPSNNDYLIDYNLIALDASFQSLTTSNLTASNLSVSNLTASQSIQTTGAGYFLGGGGNVIISSPGNIGIGTTQNLQYPLVISKRSDNSYSGIIQLGTNNTATYPFCGTLMVEDDTTYGFQHLYDTSNNRLFTRCMNSNLTPPITAITVERVSGNVGIGTNVATEQLHIRGNVALLQPDGGVQQIIAIRNSGNPTPSEGLITILPTSTGLRDIGSMLIQCTSQNWPRVSVFNPQFFGGVHAYATALSGSISNGATWTTGVLGTLTPYRSELPYGLYAVSVNFYSVGGALLNTDWLAGTVMLTGNFQSFDRQHFSGTNNITIVAGDLVVTNGTGGTRRMRLMLSPISTYLYEV